MSYARQYDDRPGEWFWENPPVVKEGDQMRSIDGSWFNYLPLNKGVEVDKLYPRRRLIQAGEGWRICHLDERPIATMLGGAEFTTDGITWCHFLNGANLSVRQLVKKNDDEQEVTGTIIAIRVPIVVDPEGEQSNFMQTVCAGCHQLSDLQGLLGCCPECRLKLEQVQPLSPQVKAVIDAARDVVKVSHYEVLTIKHVSKKISSLESALAALGEQPQTRTGLPKPEEAKG